MAVPFAIRTSTAQAVAWVYLSGEVDLAAKPEVRAHIDGHLRDDAITSVVVDLSEVTFLDSSGIGALVACRRMADSTGKGIHAVGAQGQVKTVLDLTGVSGLLAPPPIAAEAEA